MDSKKSRRQIPQYQPEAWREDDRLADGGQKLAISTFRRAYLSDQAPLGQPTVRDQTKLLELMGKINFSIIKGKRVYIEVGGVVYKTRYGGYWRSVFTGVEHYLFRCEQVSGSVWADDSDEDPAVDLPIVYSNDGWTASGHSLSFMLARE